MHFKSFLIAVITVLTSVQLYAQNPRFRLFHYQVADFCPGNEEASNLYFGVDNKIVVRCSKADQPDLKNFTIMSDAVNIKKINDSMYSMSPLSKDVQCTLYITEKTTGKRIDSVRTHLTNPSFSFSYSGMPVFNQKYSFATVVRDMKRINLRGTGCTVYTNDIRIISYKLCLDRKDTTLLSVTVNGNEAIPASFKTSVMLACEPGDYLIAKDIVLQHANGTVYKLPEYGLLIYPK